MSGCYPSFGMGRKVEHGGKFSLVSVSHYYRLQLTSQMHVLFILVNFHRI